MSKDPFDYYRFGFTDDAAIRGTVNSGYRLFIVIGLLGILLTLLIAGMSVMSSSPQKRMEALDDIKWKAIIAILLFSLPTHIGFIMGMTATIV